MSRDNVIKDAYFSDSGYGSIKTTLRDAKEIDDTKTYNDVKKCS